MLKPTKYLYSFILRKYREFEDSMKMRNESEFEDHEVARFIIDAENKSEGKENHPEPTKLIEKAKQKIDNLRNQLRKEEGNLLKLYKLLKIHKGD